MSEIPESFEGKPIVFLGVGMAGKTCARDALMGRSFDKDSRATVGLDVEADADNPLLYIDCVGRESEFTINTSFISRFRDALALVFFDAKSVESPGSAALKNFFTWLNYKRILLPEASTIAVGTRSETVSKLLSSEEIAKYNVVDWVGLDNKTGAGIDKLKESISANSESVQPAQVSRQEVFNIKAISAIFSELGECPVQGVSRDKLVDAIKKAGDQLNAPVDANEIVAFMSENEFCFPAGDKLVIPMLLPY